MNEVFGKQLQGKLKMIQYTLLKMGARTQDAEDILQETAYQFTHISHPNSINESPFSTHFFQGVLSKYE